MSENADLAALERSAAPAAGPLGLGVDLLASIGTIWTFLLMLLIVADVIGRSFLDHPITGVAEIAAHSVVAIVFLQLGAAIHAKRMTRADFLLDLIGPRAPSVVRLLDGVFCLIGAATMVFIAMSAWPGLQTAFTGREFFGVQGLFTIPTWPVRAIIVLGASVSAVVYLVQAGTELMSLRVTR